jgi:hypothetical protein
MFIRHAVKPTPLPIGITIPKLYQGMMKTAVSIPGPLFQAAERLANDLGLPRSQLYSRALERYVSEAQQQDVTARLEAGLCERESGS